MLVTMRTGEIAKLLGGAVEGNPDIDIQSAAPLSEASPDQIGFLAKGSAGESKAGCLLVRSDYNNSDGRTVIRVADPRSAFAQVLGWIHPRPKPPVGIHPTAVVDPSATIGSGSSIGPHCVIGAGVAVGADCVLHSHVTLYDGVRVGDHVILHAGVVVGADGFGFVLSNGAYAKFPQVGTVELGDDVEIGANSTVDRGALGATRIGKGTKLDNLVHIGHNCQIGQHVVIAAQTGLAGGVVVEDWAVIGGQVGIGDKARIESKAVIGSGAGILSSKIVRAGTPVWGTPARPLREYLEQLANITYVGELRQQVKEIRERLGMA